MSSEAVIIPFPSHRTQAARDAAAGISTETREWLDAEPSAIFSDEWMQWLMQD